MPNALCTIRPAPHYRRYAFEEGLRQAGFTLTTRDEPECAGDVLLTWNRNDMARRWEQLGGLVMVAENGYIGHDSNGAQLYALALKGHNGSGRWPDDGPGRWKRLGIEVKPWRASGDHVVLRAQRGIGPPGMASPPDWHLHAARKLGAIAPRLQQITQLHPGKPACDPMATADIVKVLQGAWAMCIWASAAGVRALVEGVPVCYDAPHWICEGAALSGIENVLQPMMDDAKRQRALERMAWAQWTISEIATGEPFARLMEEAKR